MKITYFVHGSTTDNESGVATGWNQGKLSEKGIVQCNKLKDALKGKTFDVVFCSDLKRASDSAKLVFGHAVADKRLRECNYGEFNGKSASDVGEMTESCVVTPFPGGESYKDVEKRIRNFLDEASNKHQNGHIAVISHRGPQLALDVITKGKTWNQAIKEDWRKVKAWKPGWDYTFEG